MPIFFGVDVVALFQIVDAGDARDLVVVAQILVAETDRLAGAGAVHHQHRNAALDEVGHAAHVLDFLGDVEAVEEHDAGRAFRLRVLRMHEIAGQAAAFERHLDDLDLDVGERRMSGGSSRRRRGRRRARCLSFGRAEALAPSGNSCRRADRRAPRSGGGRPRRTSRHGRARRRRLSRRRRTTRRRPPAPCL